MSGPAQADHHLHNGTAPDRPSTPSKGVEGGALSDPASVPLTSTPAGKVSGIGPGRSAAAAETGPVVRTGSEGSHQPPRSIDGTNCIVPSSDSVNSTSADLAPTSVLPPPAGGADSAAHDHVAPNGTDIRRDSCSSSSSGSEKNLPSLTGANTALPPTLSTSPSPSPAPALSSASVASPSSPKGEEETDQGRAPQRKHFNDDIWAPEWARHRKHVFILTNTGRPIYSRYGDESKLSHVMGILSTFVAVVQGADQDTIRYVVAGSLKVVFTIIGPIILVCVSRGGQPVSVLARQLTFLHSQIISILTGGVHKVLETRPNFDLRNLLGGAERFFDELIHVSERDLSFHLAAMHCLRVDPYLRGMLAKALTCSPHPDLTFALLLSGFQIVQFACPGNHPLHPSDLQLIMNIVNGSPSFRNTASWTPICLPAFNSRGFMHAYVSFILPEAVLVLLSPRQEAFGEIQKCRKVILANMKANGLLELLQERTQRPLCSPAEIGVPGLMHFLYKDRRTQQFTTCALAAPYTNVEEAKRLMRLYQGLHHRVHAPSSGPHKVYYHCSHAETVLGWQTYGFELYATFGPLESKLVCIRGCNSLLNWIKREESSLFVLNPPLY